MFLIDSELFFYLCCWVFMFLLAMMGGAEYKWCLSFQMEIIIINI
ncbi:hypothetical protein SALWKB12_0259 [Snodgrassella communis]|uniref:Uncharacterized protein n=1 Tax=Snodgrassella communis TaxID=2946699 RepID=A0A836MSZ3_9NEIS|nr:hypothetical protein SALWKB12_0259 [Snodgrassella communis]KDN15702.1 hypothetical protein SALWKB29_0121 [Snodgrassella communis]